MKSRLKRIAFAKKIQYDNDWIHFMIVHGSELKIYLNHQLLNPYSKSIKKKAEK